MNVIITGQNSQKRQMFFFDIQILAQLVPVVKGGSHLWGIEIVSGQHITVHVAHNEISV